MKIKYLFAVALLAVSSNALSDNNGFCKGYDVGYKDGWCNDEQFCSKPFSPACPFRNYDEQNTFKDGYQRGFADGVIAKERSKQ